MKLLRTRISRTFLLLLFLSYGAGTTLFAHVHSNDGKTLVHSHFYNPFKDGKSTGHDHSKKDFALLNVLSKFITSVSLGFTFLAEVELFSILVLINYSHIIETLVQNESNGLRAPPAYL